MIASGSMASENTSINFEVNRSRPINALAGAISLCNMFLFCATVVSSPYASSVKDKFQNSTMESTDLVLYRAAA
jgi:hypothetical protein